MNRQARWDERVEHGQDATRVGLLWCAPASLKSACGWVNQQPQKRKFVMQRKAAIIQQWYGRRRMAKRLKDSERLRLQRFIIRWQNMYRLSRKNASQRSCEVAAGSLYAGLRHSRFEITRRISSSRNSPSPSYVPTSRLELWNSHCRGRAERMQDLDAIKRLTTGGLEHMACWRFLFSFRFLFRRFYFFC